MSNSFLNKLRNSDRKAIKEYVDYMLPFRRFPDGETYVSCPDSQCRQFRLYIQTDKIGRDDCPICKGNGWVPISRVPLSKIRQSDLDRCTKKERAQILKRMNEPNHDVAPKPEASAKSFNVLPLFKEVAK